jgi:hypothetical protein
VFSVERRVGRLVEVSIADITTLAEVDAFIARVFEVLGAAPTKIVFCVDMLGMNVLAGEGFEKFVAAMRRDNPRFIRSAILISTSRATFGLQMARMVREVGNPNRRTFKDVSSLSSWLEQVLEPTEKERLHAFLQEVTDRERARGRAAIS